MPRGVMFGYVCDELVRAEFLRSVIDLLGSAAGELIGATGHASAGSEVGLARNLLTAQFLDTDCEWLFSVDTDMVFAPGVLPGLLACADPQQRPVVSALAEILDAQRGPMPSVYERDAGGDYRRLAKVQNGRLCKVDGTGAACFLAHRGVYEKMLADLGGPVWYNHLPTSGPVELGEDLSFCSRLAAAGFPLWLDTRLRVGHMRTIMLGDVT